MIKCDVVNNYKIKVKILSARAGKGKTRYIMRQLLKEDIRCIYLCPFTRDCEGGQETFDRLFNKNRCRVIGLTATVDKLTRIRPKSNYPKFQIYELEEEEEVKYHVRMIRVKSSTEKMAKYIGPIEGYILIYYFIFVERSQQSL